jgi:hypothetical protein
VRPWMRSEALSANIMTDALRLAEIIASSRMVNDSLFPSWKFGH